MKFVDAFWSHQSPYCYFALDRLLALNERADVTVTLRPILPGVIRDGDLFKDRPDIEKRYFLLDVRRTADFLGVAYREADPYPVNFSPESMYRAEGDQSRALRLYYLTAAAIELDRGWRFLDCVSRLIWDGSTRNWHRPDVMGAALRSKGIDLEELERTFDGKEQEYDAQFARNRDAMLAAGHWGAPCFVYNGEPFYGQDRFDQLCWRIDNS